MSNATIQHRFFGRLRAQFRVRAGLILTAALLPVAAFGHSYGPAPRVTAAPGDDQQACTQCHTTNPLNSDRGSVKILLQGAANYIPGAKQRIVVQVAHPDQVRWGFEMSARGGSTPDKTSAGTFTPIDNTTQVLCEDYGPAPCASGPSFITHTSIGTRNGQKLGGSFQFDWTAPATDVGPVTLYVAGNAANGNGSPAGDFIYTSTVVLTALNPKAPASTGNIISSATGLAGPIAPNTWATIYGTNLGVTTRSWNDGDFSNGTMPFSLDGVSVLMTRAGQPRLAAVGYVSPTQVNFLVPTDISLGAGVTTVRVRNSAGITADLPITLQANAPQLFTADGKNVLAAHADGNFAGKAGILSAAVTPATPGETITVFGTGLGATTPALIPLQLAPGGANLAVLPTVTIGGAPATVVSASALAGAGGVYQVRVTVPGATANGDQPLVMTLGGVNSASALLTVQK